MPDNAAIGATQWLDNSSNIMYEHCAKDTTICKLFKKKKETETPKLPKTLT